MTERCELGTITLRSGSVYPALKLNNGIVLTHPGLNPERLEGDYEKRVVEVLGTDAGLEQVLNAVDGGIQLLLPIGDHWKAPMSVSSNDDGEVICLLHYGPA